MGTGRLLGAAAALGGAIAFAACGATAAAPMASTRAAGAEPAAAGRTTASTAALPPTRPARVVLRAAASRYGRVLLDRRGYALYLFTRDTRLRSKCSGACARAWPPYTVPGPGRGVSGARSSLIGTTRRADGKLQLTYAGHPLYHYVGDRAPGQILCQDVEEYGGHWWVLSPGGGAITAG